MLSLAMSTHEFSANMTFTSSHTPAELGTPGLHAECLSSDPPIVCMQDIINHEHALVESIPDEDRAALMPIIRFVKNTLQDPFTALPELSHGRTVDALKLTDEAKMQVCNNHYISTNYRCHKEIAFHENKELRGPIHEDAVGQRGASMPHTYAFNVTNTNNNLESCHVSMPWQRVTFRRSTECLYQQYNYHDALHQKEMHNFDSPQPRLPLPKRDNHAHQLQQLRGGLFFSSSSYAGLCEPNTLTSFKIDSASHVDNVYSSLDMDSFNLEELRRSLRPPVHEMDSDGNDIQSNDVNNFGDGGDGVDGEDDNMDEDHGNNNSYLCHPNQDEERDASDVEWPLYWGNGIHYYPTMSSGSRLQFPKVHCRRRNVVKKAIGWIKKRAAESLVSRVRHKRKCNLPCCTDCETGTKRRKASGYGSRKCARLSTMKKNSSSLQATTPENTTKSNRQSIKARGAHVAPASSESCDEKEASQVTLDLDSSSLATALTMVLTNSKGRGLTSCEALHALVQEGYLQAVSCEDQALASHVKTTLKECPQFKELKNHRFIFDAGGAKLANKIALGVQNCRAPQDGKVSLKELSLSQVVCSGKRERSLSQITCSQDLTVKLDPSPSGKRYENTHQRGLRCLKSKGRHWQCNHIEHQRRRWALVTTISGCSSCEIVDSCGASNKSQREAKEEETLATCIDSYSGQSAAEQDPGQPIRCCRTDGKNWQCSNQAQKGSMYCERHQSRCKKGMVRQTPPCESQEKKKLRHKEPTGDNQCVRRLSMQLRPRRNAALDICLK